MLTITGQLILPQFAISLILECERKLERPDESHPRGTQSVVSLCLTLYFFSFPRCSSTELRCPQLLCSCLPPRWSPDHHPHLCLVNSSPDCIYSPHSPLLTACLQAFVLSSCYLFIFFWSSPCVGFWLVIFYLLLVFPPLPDLLILTLWTQLLYFCFSPATLKIFLLQSCPLLSIFPSYCHSSTVWFHMANSDVLDWVCRLISRRWEVNSYFQLTPGQHDCNWMATSISHMVHSKSTQKHIYI